VGECEGLQGPTPLTLNTRAIWLEDGMGQQKVFGPRRSSRSIGCPIESTALHHAFISLLASYGAWRYTIFVRGIGVEVLPLQQHLHAPRVRLRIEVCCHLHLQHSYRHPIASAKLSPLRRTTSGWLHSVVYLHSHSQY